MNYEKIYNKLILTAKNRINSSSMYLEEHHIIPKSLGGQDNRNNLVSLTAREHYIAHMLLLKVAEQHNDIQEYKKMLYAFNCMKWGRVNGKRSFKFNSRLYQQLKEKYSEIRIDFMKTNNPMYGKIWICNFDLEESKVWNESDPIPKGWIKGRHSKDSFKKIKEKQKLREQKQKIKEEKSKKTDGKMIPICDDLKLYREMFEEFKINEFEGVVKKFNYTKTRNNLLILFKKYFSDYKPKICNRWKNKKSS